MINEMIEDHSSCSDDDNDIFSSVESSTKIRRSRIDNDNGSSMSVNSLGSNVLDNLSRIHQNSPVARTMAGVDSKGRTIRCYESIRNGKGRDRGKNTVHDTFGAYVPTDIQNKRRKLTSDTVVPPHVIPTKILKPNSSKAKVKSRIDTISTRGVIKSESITSKLMRRKEMCDSNASLLQVHAIDINDNDSGDRNHTEDKDIQEIQSNSKEVPNDVISGGAGNPLSNGQVGCRWDEELVEIVDGSTSQMQARTPDSEKRRNNNSNNKRNSFETFSLLSSRNIRDKRASSNEIIDDITLSEPGRSGKLSTLLKNRSDDISRRRALHENAALQRQGKTNGRSERYYVDNDVPVLSLISKGGDLYPRSNASMCSSRLRQKYGNADTPVEISDDDQDEEALKLDSKRDRNLSKKKADVDKIFKMKKLKEKMKDTPTSSKELIGFALRCGAYELQDYGTEIYRATLNAQAQYVIVTESGHTCTVFPLKAGCVYYRLGSVLEGDDPVLMLVMEGCRGSVSARVLVTDPNFRKALESQTANDTYFVMHLASLNMTQVNALMCAMLDETSNIGDLNVLVPDDKTTEHVVLSSSDSEDDEMDTARRLLAISCSPKFEAILESHVSLSSHYIGDVTVRHVEHDEADSEFRATKAKKMAQRRAAIECNTPLFTYPPDTVGAVQIRGRDIMLLEPGEWLNDNIIDFYMLYLQNEVFSSKQRDRIHILSSFFWKRLKKEVTNRDVTFVKGSPILRWTKDVDIFAKDYIFMPVCQSSHWFLVIICHPGLLAKALVANLNTSFSDEDFVHIRPHQRPCIVVLDSLGGGVRCQQLVTAITWWLSAEYADKHGGTILDFRSSVPTCNLVAGVYHDSSMNLSLLVAVSPQQMNFSDCGVFLVANVRYFMERMLPDGVPTTCHESDLWQEPFRWPDSWFDQKDVTAMRPSIAADITHMCKLLE